LEEVETKIAEKREQENEKKNNAHETDIKLQVKYQVMEHRLNEV
jgi:hypothetical protein